MKKSFIIPNIILFLSVIIGDIFYINFGGLWLKGLTSLLFVALGVFNLIYTIKSKDDTTKKFAIIMLIGLIFAMLGDIVLNIYFIGGAILFAIGHVFYFIAYCYLVKFKWSDLIIGSIIFVFAILFITLAPIFKFENIIMELVCIFYALIISLMVGKAISNLIREKTLTNILLVIGSILFFFSDLMLLFECFANAPRIADILCLATYYPAQCLLAFSISNPTLKQSQNN